MDSIYAIGDIHGYASELERVLKLIDADGGSKSKAIFLGDYTDRGPDSRAVIDILIEGQANGHDWVTLKGNHDRLFEWFMEEEPRHDPHMLIGYHWFHERIGGRETLESYGLDATSNKRLGKLHEEAQEAIPVNHLEFLRNLRLTFETDDLFFCHAGIRPEVPLAEQDEEDLVWIRQEFHAFKDPHPKLIVHGHTPVPLAQHYGNRVNLDSGAGFGDPLTVAVFDDDGVWHLTDKGREKMEPTF